MRRRAFTLLELLVVLAIIGLILALFLPAVQQVREAARRIQCAGNLNQFGIAMNAYHADNGIFPPGSANGFSLQISLLPYMDKTVLYNSVNFSFLPYYFENQTVRVTKVDSYLCPSDPWSNSSAGLGGWATSYAGNFGTGVQKYGYNGIFAHLQLQGGSVKAADVTDGLTQTAAMSEILVAHGDADRRRVIWNTPAPLTSSWELDAFAQLCPSMSISTAPSYSPWSRGRPWVMGEAGYTLYNHILTPNENSCFNGTRVQEGAYSAASLHGGVQVLFADGHVALVTEKVSARAWRGLGSRDGGETDSSLGF